VCVCVRVSAREVYLFSSFVLLRRECIVSYDRLAAAVRGMQNEKGSLIAWFLEASGRAYLRKNLKEEAIPPSQSRSV
jgi:hypothetical protein